MEQTKRLEVQLIDQFKLRPATMADLEEAVNLFNICSQELYGKEKFDPGEVKTEWATPGFDLRRDTRILEGRDNQVVGYVEVWDLAPHVRQYVWGRVHPDFRGKKLGTWLLEWAESRARTSIRKAPPGARVALINQAVSTNADAESLFLSRGYRHVRSNFDMLIALDKPPQRPHWPSRLHGAGSIRVRTMRPGEERAVMEADVEAFRDHWGFVDRPVEEEFKRWKHWIENDPNFDAGLWFLAVDGDEIAGVSLCAPKYRGDPDLGWVHSLAVRRPWRRRGLALALLLHSFGVFYQRGIMKVGLGVDSQNLTGATRLYEKARMHVHHQYNTYEKELRPGEELVTERLA